MKTISNLYSSRIFGNNYSEKLQKPEWQNKRQEILKRDGYMCQRCSITDTELHIHHCYYENGLEPWEYNNQSLITLCRDCHEYETAHLDRNKRDMLNSLSRKGLLANVYEQLSFAFESVPIWGNDATAWQAISWAIRTPAIINTIISQYVYQNEKRISSEVVNG